MYYNFWTSVRRVLRYVAGYFGLWYEILQYYVQFFVFIIVIKVCN